MRPLLLFPVLPVTLAAQIMVHLPPQTDQAFTTYREKAESQMDWMARFTALKKAGEVVIAPFEGDGSIDVRDGLVHDWAAATIVPGASVEKSIAVLQDYANYKSVFAPEVTDSRTLSHDGNHWEVYLKLVQKKVLTVTLNSEYAVDYKPLGDGRWSLVSRSTKVTEVDGKKEFAAGAGHGFLWKLNAYWLIEPRKDGVYLECRTISLSRNIPTGLGWMIRPMVSTVPRESLQATLASIARALKN
jgi:hypothetical protein